MIAAKMPAPEARAEGALHFPSAEDRLTVSQRSVEEGFRLQRHRNESALGVQPSQSDRDEPADRGLGRQAAGCC